MRSPRAVIRHYGAVYLQFVSTSFARDSSFRANFILLFALDFIFYCTTLFNTGFIFNQISSIGGWNREQFLFFLSFMLAVDYVHMTIISPNLWELGENIRNGQLDYLLVRPISPLFSSLFRNFRSGSVANGIVIIPVVIVLGRRAGLHGLDWFLLPPLVLFALSMLVSIEMLLLCSMFWVIDGTSINFLRMQLQSVSRLPDFAFGSIFRRIFTVFIPLLLIGNAPVRLLFHHADYVPMVLLLALLAILCILIRFFWNLGLSRYDSASS